jgi:DNA-binding response OmpR family regulator
LNIHTYLTNTLQDTLKYLEESDVDVIILNLELPDINGIEAFIKLYNEYDVPIVVMTSEEKEELGSKVLRLGAQDYFTRNIQLTPIGLRRIVMHAINRDAFIKDTVESQSAVVRACDVLREGTQSLRQIRQTYGAIHGQEKSNSIRVV